MAVGSAPSAVGYPAGSAANGSSGGVDHDDEGGLSITTLRQRYTDFQSAKNAEIEEQRVARHYYHNDQLTADQLKELKRRKQPAVIRNKIDRKINGVVGLIERLRQDPKAYPRTPQEDERGGADLATAVIRYVLDKPNDDDEDWGTTAAEAARNGSINGIFGIELSLVAGDQGDPDISFALVDNDCFFYDAKSVRYSFADARDMGVAKWVDEETAVEMFPDQEELIRSLVSTGGGGLEGVQQQDRERHWIDTTAKRLFLVEHWYKVRGEWRWCIYTHSTKFASGPSPFVDERGKTIAKYIMGSVNIDHDGDRYGFVRGLKSLQDEYNARGSKALHLLNTRRIIMETGAVADVDELRREAVRPDGVIVRNPGKELEFDDQKNLSDFAGQLEVMTAVGTEIENFGPNPALLGEGIENKSGRAIALLQQAGIAELGPFILSFRGWKIRVYRAIWNAVKQHWTSERWIRVTDDEGIAQFLGINQLTQDEFGLPVIENKVGALDVDIILDEGPDTINLMQDTYDALLALGQSGAQVPPEILIELAPIPQDTKRKLTEIMKQAKQPSPFDEKVMGIKVQEAEGKARKVNAEATKIEGEAAVTPMKDRAAAWRDVASGAAAIAKARQPGGDVMTELASIRQRNGLDQPAMFDR